MLSSLLRRALGLYAAAAMLAACGGAGTRAGLPPSAAQPTQTRANPFKNALLYAGGDVSSYVIAIPAGRVVGHIAAPAFGTCSDSNGNVYFTAVKTVSEYAHGGTSPIATFSVPGTAYSCSVDPTTGNLAVVVFCFKKCGEEVFVFGPHGRPKKYPTSVRSLLYCAYDGNGNLFVDGYNGIKFALLELANGASSFARITLNQSIQSAAQIQWDGTYLAIETRLHPVIYQVSISGSTAQVVGTTHLNGVGARATQSWIADGKIAVPSGPGTKRALEIFIWDYPAGGNPKRVLKGFVTGYHAQIDGVTYSLVP